MFMRLSATCQESGGHCHDKPWGSVLSGLIHTLCLYLPSSPGPGQARYQTLFFFLSGFQPVIVGTFSPALRLICASSPGFCPPGLCFAFSNFTGHLGASL